MRWAPILVALVLAAVPARAEKVVAGLSSDDVSITATFDGSGILIYGAVKREEPIPTDSSLEVVITVQGPSAPVTVRRKARQAGIWVNTSSVEVDLAPSFYEIATTGPFQEIVSETEDVRHKISIPRAIRSVGAPPDVTDSQSFTDALIRIRERRGVYRLDEGNVRLVEETLFRADFALPANLTEGAYSARIFLLRDKAVIDMREEVIEVRKVGLERWLFTLSREWPAAYGILALAIAVLAGWGASAAFRYIRN
jgi:uncharacterized protein (TIGR02186 family)